MSTHIQESVVSTGKLTSLTTRLSQIYTGREMRHNQPSQSTLAKSGREENEQYKLESSNTGYYLRALVHV
jgi:hypothetical protein